MNKFTVRVLFCFVLFLCFFHVYAEDPLSLLKKADSLASYTETDFSAEYTMVQEKPGEGFSKTVAAVFRRDAEEKYVIIILEPKINKGQGYLKLGETLWFYDNESRRFNSSSSKDRFQNSNARNSDFTRSTMADDYDITGAEEVKLGRFTCQLLSLKANNENVTYPIMRIWISEDGLVRKTEDYSLSGRLLRTTAIPEYQRYENKYIPEKILIIDNLKGEIVDGKFIHEKTQITISKVSLKDVPDYVFSKTFLEKINK